MEFHPEGIDSGEELAKHVGQRHYQATIRMGACEQEFPFLTRLKLEQKQMMAQICAQVLSKEVASFCPEDGGECDLCMIVVNLMEALALVLQRDEEILFRLLQKAIQTKDKKGKGALYLESMGAFLGGPLKHAAESITLNEFVFFTSPALFTRYREVMNKKDAMLEVYNNAVQEQQEMGWTKGEGVRRINYVAVILNNGGRLKTEIVRYAEAVACAPDYTQMPQVKANVRTHSSQLYNIIQGMGSEEMQEEAWRQQQAAALEQDKRLRELAKEKGSVEEAAKILKKENKKAMRARCAQCGTPSIQRCSRCKEARYCSAECQKKNWKEHRDNCQKK